MPEQCELGVHCNGLGVIRAHLVEFKVFSCISCVAGEEGITKAQVRRDLKDAEKSQWIHPARNKDTHRCPSAYYREGDRYNRTDA